ncbi:MAG: cellulose binding domain-containing protein [Kibdelosporangium sp.]
MPSRQAFFGALVAAAGVIALAGPAAAVTATSVSCTYETELSTWPGNFMGSVMVTNTGTEAVDDWRIEFDLPGHAHITHGWYAIFITLTGHIRVMPEKWNSHLTPGMSVDPSFVGIQSGVVTVSNVTLNGVSCTAKA